MSLYKSTTSIEKIWDKCLVSKSSAEIGNFCEMCKENLQFTEKFLFRTKFQQDFVPYFSSMLCEASSSLEYYLQVLDPLLWVIEYVRSKKKFKLKKLLNELIDSFFTGLKIMVSIKCEYSDEVLNRVGKFVGICENFLDLHLNSENNIEKLDKQLLDVFGEISKNKNYRNLVWRFDESGEKNDVLGSILNIVLKIALKSHKKYDEGFIFSNFAIVFTTIENDVKELTECKFACERFLMILKITNELLDKNKNFCLEFLLKFGEKVKSVFGECLSVFGQNLTILNSFLTDKNTLAEIFSNFLTIFLATTKGPEKNFTVWNIPIIIFHMIFNPVTSK